MITSIQNKKDVELLRYQLTRTYSNKDFNGPLKQFAMDQLDSIINDNNKLSDFITSQANIEHQRTLQQVKFSEDLGVTQDTIAEGC